MHYCRVAVSVGHFDIAIRAQTRTLDAQIDELKEELQEREQSMIDLRANFDDARKYIDGSYSLLVSVKEQLRSQGFLAMEATIIQGMELLQPLYVKVQVRSEELSVVDCVPYVV